MVETFSRTPALANLLQRTTLDLEAQRQQSTHRDLGRLVVVFFETERYVIVLYCMLSLV